MCRQFEILSNDRHCSLLAVYLSCNELFCVNYNYVYHEMMCEVYFCFRGKKNPNPNLEMCKEMRIHIEETRQTDRIKLIKKLCRFSSLS